MKKLFEIDLNLLVLLDAILATGSLTAAAEKVRLSKPAMSHALDRIRRLVGDEILVRSGRQWVLTERARAMAAPLAEILSSTSALLFTERSFSAATLTREFVIHTTDSVVSILGVAIGRATAAEAPGVDLRFMPVLPDEVEALRDAVDLAIGVFPKLPGEFRKQRLFEDRFCCVVRKDHPSIKGRLTLDKYIHLHHVLVAPRGRAGGAVDVALAAVGARRRVSRALPFFMAALQCVAESDCIATLSLRLGRAHAERFGLEILRPPLDLPSYAIEQVWHPRVEAEPGHVWLRRLVASAARSLPRV